MISILSKFSVIVSNWERNCYYFQKIALIVYKLFRGISNLLYQKNAVYSSYNELNIGDIFYCFERNSIKFCLIVYTKLFLKKESFRCEIYFRNFKNLLPFSEFIAIPFLLHSSIMQFFLFVILQHEESKKLKAKSYTFTKVQIIIGKKSNISPFQSIIIKDWILSLFFYVKDRFSTFLRIFSIFYRLLRSMDIYDTCYENLE